MISYGSKLLPISARSSKEVSWGLRHATTGRSAGRERVRRVRACLNMGSYLFCDVAVADVVVPRPPPAESSGELAEGACTRRRQVLERVHEAGAPDLRSKTDVKRSTPEGSRGGREGR